MGNAKPATADHPLFGVYDRLLNDGRIEIPPEKLEAVQMMNRAQRRLWAKKQRKESPSP